MIASEGGVNFNELKKLFKKSINEVVDIEDSHTKPLGHRKEFELYSKSSWEILKGLKKSYLALTQLWLLLGEQIRKTLMGKQQWEGLLKQIKVIPFVWSKKYNPKFGVIWLTSWTLKPGSEITQEGKWFLNYFKIHSSRNDETHTD